MTISDQIRALARDGVKTAEIARRLGIQYQHAYNVLQHAALRPGGPLRSTGGGARDQRVAKPPLTTDVLTAAGFVISGLWLLSPTEQLALDRGLPKHVGVYAFAKGPIVQYVGVATMGLSRRLYFYQRPGKTQRTSLRLNTILIKELQAGASIEVYTAAPPDLEWNGLPVHGSAGLELGLIKKFSLPWNVRSAQERNARAAEEISA